MHPSRAPYLSLLAAFIASACTPVDPATEPTATSTDPAASSTSEPTDTTPVSTTTPEPTTTIEPTTGPVPPTACQNGTVDATEACDDGNTVNGDGCNNDCQPSAAQLFEFRTDDPGFENIYSIATDADGIVVGGSQDGQGWIARFDPELTQQWSQLIGPHFIRAVALTDGAIYVGGAIKSDADGQDLWVARLTADATAITWEDTVSGGEGDDWATQVAAVDGDLVITGMAFATQLWTRRYASDGTPKWTASFEIGQSYFDIFPLGSGMVVTPTEVIVGWNLRVEGIKLEQLVAYPLTGGDPSWTATLPDTVGGISGLALAPDGSLALSSGQNYEFLTTRRLTAQGAIEWSSEECVGSYARDVAVDSQGDIVVIGDGQAKGGKNIRLCKFSPEGVLRWGKDIDGGAGDDFGFTVAIDATDRVIAGGQFYVDPTRRDAWLAVFSP